MIQFEEFVARSMETASTRELEGLFAQMLRDEGYENYVLTSASPDAIQDVAWHHFPEGYADAYLGEDWARVDPILQHSQLAHQAFEWDDYLAGCEISAAQRDFLGASRELGVVGGLTVPLHGPGRAFELISISRRADCDRDPCRTRLLLGMVMQTRSRFLELRGEIEHVTESEHVRLTRRELECLNWVRDGKTYAEMAEIMGIAYKTVDFHMQNIMNKLGATNKIMAVVIALQRGILRL